MKRKNQKGFTLVEVIVVAVIVAVLAAVAIPLYIGYINDSNRQAAQNGAGSLLSFISAGCNSQSVFNPADPVNYVGGAGAVITATTPAPGNQTVSFTCPTGVTYVVAGSCLGGYTVTATKSGQVATAP